MTEFGRKLTTVEGDIRAFGGILQRIEQSVSKAHDAMDAQDERSRHSPVAIATVLVTIMSMLVGGAWVTGSRISQTSTQLDDQAKFSQQIELMRNRELDVVERRVERLEDHPGGHGGQQTQQQ